MWSPPNLAVVTHIPRTYPCPTSIRRVSTRRLFTFNISYQTTRGETNQFLQTLQWAVPFWRVCALCSPAASLGRLRPVKLFQRMHVDTKCILIMRSYVERNFSSVKRAIYCYVFDEKKLKKWFFIEMWIVFPHLMKMYLCKMSCTNCELSRW